MVAFNRLLTNAKTVEKIFVPDHRAACCPPFKILTTITFVSVSSEKVVCRLAEDEYYFKELTAKLNCYYKNPNTRKQVELVNIFS